MKTEKEEDEILNWRLRQEWHSQDLSSPRRSRYMADVRHPLKALPLRDKPKARDIHYRPFGERFVVPEVARCGKCKEMVRLSEFSKHPCFGPRFPVK